MNIKPMGDMHIIKLDERNDRTAGGLYIKEAWESAINSGTLQGGGEATTLEAGLRVIINPYALIEIGEKNTYLIKEADIVATITDDTPEGEVVNA
jgi:co-chaperonin GroES (HSP10)